MNFRLFAGRQGISEDKDDGVTTQEHFADKSVLVDGLGLLFACKDTKIVIANNSNQLFILLTFACLGHFGPHLLDTLQNHVAMPVKSFNSAEEFLVVSAIDQNLCVILDGLCQN